MENFKCYENYQNATETVSKCCWTNSTSRFAQCMVATTFNLLIKQTNKQTKTPQYLWEGIQLSTIKCNMHVFSSSGLQILKKKKSFFTELTPINLTTRCLLWVGDLRRLCSFKLQQLPLILWMQLKLLCRWLFPPAPYCMSLSIFNFSPTFFPLGVCQLDISLELSIHVAETVLSTLPCSQTHLSNIYANDSLILWAIDVWKLRVLLGNNSQSA